MASAVQRVGVKNLYDFYIRPIDPIVDLATNDDALCECEVGGVVCGQLAAFVCGGSTGRGYAGDLRCMDHALAFSRAT